MAALSVLAIAVASSKVGYVYLPGGKLQDWGVVVKVAKSSGDLVGYVQELINTLKPDVVVTEKCDNSSRKGIKSRSLIAAVAGLASHNPVLDVSIPRAQRYLSKYDEAQELAKLYLEIEAYLPANKRRIFDFEPRNMIIFEALSFADDIINRSPTQVAIAMG
jgi:hypothetical protein